MLGRSDGVLNPSGVRFGSSDIYAVVERWFAAEVAESICVGQKREQDADESVVLFLLMKPGRKLDEDLAKRLRDRIASEMTKRHVPRYMFERPEVPVTVNGKKVELPVKHIISGRKIKPSGTLLNPQSLEYFYRLCGPRRTQHGDYLFRCPYPRGHLWGVSTFFHSSEPLGGYGHAERRDPVMPPLSTLCLPYRPGSELTCPCRRPLDTGDPDQLHEVDRSRWL